MAISRSQTKTLSFSLFSRLELGRSSPLSPPISRSRVLKLSKTSLPLNQTSRLVDSLPKSSKNSALTSESLPLTKNPSDGVYSGSTCKQGKIEAVVIATGVHTFFGKAAHLVENTTHVGHFQKSFCMRWQVA